MKHIPSFLRLAWAAVFLSACLPALAQGPPARLARPITGSSRVVLPGSKNPRALPANDAGAVSPDLAMNGITLVFNRSATQQAALETLLTAQQDPTSPQYHQWLTPEQFAARFGVADSDIAAVQNWLQSQGFNVASVARSRNRITFSGTAGEVAAAFGTELHHYRVNGVTHLAPSTDLSLPAALAPLVANVEHLSDFRPKPQVRHSVARPQYTSSETQNHYLDPLDIATQYDVNSLYSAGFNGAGQTIAVAGQSYIPTSDITNFQTALGLPVHAPNLVLVPGSGVEALSIGDQGESDIDVEYSGGMARGATVDLVYVGDNPKYSAFDGLTYAVTEDIAPIISLSYGACELDTPQTQINSLVALGQQANSQGQTILAATGDNGSTTCYGYTDLSTAQQESPSVDVPADLASVTAMGGLQMAAGTYATGDTQYFAAATGSDNYSSLLSYVPEVVWNEDSASYGLSSGGGGTSVVIARPTWQTGVPGIAAGPYRLLPDLALQASTGSPGYVYCSSDPSGLATNQTTSCSSGLRDTSTGDLTVAGGTSFSAPIFAGMLAVLNQAKNEAAQGNINPTLYGLASNATTYASVFHDITSGGNQCTAGTVYCSTAGAAVYAAGTGYDMASGLGSIDLAKLVAAWPSTSTSSLIATTTSLAAASTTAAAGSTQQVTITVTDTVANGSPATGTVQILVDGTTANPSLALSAGIATYSYTAPAATGTHVITAVYSGDAAHAPSESSVTITVGTVEASGSFSVAATNITLPLNSSANGTVTITPSSGYTGLVNFSLSGSTGNLSLCYGVNPVSAYPGKPESTTLTLSEGTACGSAAARVGSGMKLLSPGKTSRNAPPASPWQRWPAPVAFAGLLLGGFALRRRSRRIPALLSLALLMAIGMGLSGCGGSSGASSVIGSTTPQTYTVTLTGVDSVNTNIANSTTFTLTVN